MSRHVDSLCDDKARTVINDFDFDAPIDGLSGQEYARRACVFLDVGERLGDVLEQNRLDRSRNLLGEPQVDLRLDSGMKPD